MKQNILYNMPVIGRVSLLGVLLAVMISGVMISEAMAATAKKIDSNVDVSLELFKEVGGANEIIEKAAGILVFPKVFKGGFGIGAEFGEGALRIEGETVGYYNTVAGSIGFQFGGQKKTIIIAFMQEDALQDFQGAAGWKVGVDASVAVIAVGAGGSIDTANLNEPIIAFVFDQKGLMYNLTLEGAKITKINK